MVSYRLVVSLFNMGRSLQQAGKPAPLDITCSRKKQIHPVDWCQTRIENPKFLKVPKAKIEDAFNRMGAKCNGFAGWASLPGFDGVQLWVRHHTRGGVRYEDDMELHHPFCYADTERKLVVADCM
ncbi:hypothetical protein KEM48_002022, partial [Puccinia striiformis f. sp. tritici PST-130]